MIDRYRSGRYSRPRNPVDDLFRAQGELMTALGRVDDLGEALDSGAHLAGLIRSRSGSFSLSESLTLDQALSLLAP